MEENSGYTIYEFSLQFFQIEENSENILYWLQQKIMTKFFLFE